MSNARIIEIPATRQIRSGKNNTMRKMRVAAYCRVSTEEEEQQGSFETQKLYYTEKINSTSEWELAGIYADDGISGIHTKKRDGFNQMIQDCKKKKIDLILTKSISRFARNTLDSIQYVRMLKAIGIAVIFEKENINTSTMNSEMILTVLSAFAQAESESISQNVARGKRMGFRQGKFPFPYGQILGYRKGLDGKPEVIPEEAEVIRMIFNSYLQGASLLTIKKKLEAGGVLTARGNKKWSSESVQRILQNEKYCGDVLLQKTFSTDVISKKVVKNTGQLPKYLIQNHHAGIVTREQFQAVQAELARRSALRSDSKQAATGRSCYTSKYALSDRLVCGECGKLYRRKTRNIKGNIYHEWRCISRLDYGKRYCHNSPTLREIPLQNAILAAINEAMSEKPILLNHIKSAMSLELLPVQEQTMSLADIDRRLAQLDAQFQSLLAEAIDAEDKERCNAKFAEILAEQTELKKQKEAILQSSTDAERTCARLVQAEQALEQAAPTVTEWNESTVRQLVERVTVLSANEVLVQLKGGKEIHKRLE